VLLHFANTLEQILRQPVIAHCPIEPLDVGVLLWLPGLCVFHPDTLLASPGAQHLADVLGTIVTGQHRRFATSLDDLLKTADHPLGGQREVRVDAQRFAVEVVDYVEQSEGASILQLVVHEVH